MKKLLFLLLLVMPYAANAQENDTLTILKPQRVSIITGDSIQKIKVYGKEDNDRYTYENSIQLVDSNYVSETTINRDWGIFNVGLGKDSFTDEYPYEVKTAFSHLGVGQCVAIDGDNRLSISTGSSWELFWTILQWKIYGKGKHNGYSFGIGLDWRNYRMTGFSHFEKGNNGVVGLANYPEGCEPDFSRIKIFSLQFPLMWNYRFNKHCSFSLGTVFNLNLYGSIKNKYRDADGQKRKETVKHIHQRPFTVDIMASMNIRSLPTIYCKYSPMSILNSDFADHSNFQPLSFGFIF